VAEAYAFIKSFWLVWCVLLFAGIVAWVFWPGRRRELETYARIPLEDDEERDGERHAGR
jgi:cbb3-type cytochrome oxidase subunit 3